MKLTLTCDHGTRTVEYDDGREGIGADHYVSSRIAATMPRCPYCDIPWQPTCSYGGPGEGVVAPASDSNDSRIGSPAATGILRPITDSQEAP